MSSSPSKTSDSAPRNRHSQNGQRAKMAAREAAILTAATEVFAQSGVDGTRMAEIARRADVAEGTLYLYYRNKQDLLAGVVGHFWQQLTEGAEAAIDVKATSTAQLRALATYHLQALLDQFEVVALTYRARQRHGQPEFQLEPIRDYVRVFDQIVRRGIDRGELASDLPLWQCRDVFFGTLEFSARTLHLHQQGFDPLVIDNLMELLSAYTVKTNIQQNQSPQVNQDITLSTLSLTSESDSQSRCVEERLTRIEALLNELKNNR